MLQEAKEALKANPGDEEGTAPYSVDVNDADMIRLGGSVLLADRDSLTFHHRTYVSYDPLHDASVNLASCTASGYVVYRSG